MANLKKNEARLIVLGLDLLMDLAERTDRTDLLLSTKVVRDRIASVKCYHIGIPNAGDEMSSEVDDDGCNSHPTAP